MTADLIIRNGELLDGSGRQPYVADLEINAGRITAIGNVAREAVTEIDATGRSVAPGFIDIHSHSDYTLLVDPRAESAIHQGVTLEVLGNCGHGCFPLHNKQLARRAIYGITDDLPLDWSSAAEYFDRLSAARPAVNVLSLVPNGQLRMAAMGVQARAATPVELGHMVAELEQAMDAGAFGYSTGLEYAAECGAESVELETLCRVVARRGGLYATHTRFRDQGSVEAVREAVQTGQKTGVRLQISHLLPRSGSADCERCIDVVDEAIRSGQSIAFDMHTRLFGLTFLHAMLPPWITEDHPERLRALLMQPEVRAQILAHKSIVTASGNWRRLVLLDNAIFPQYARMTFEEIGLRRRQSPGDAALDLLASSLEAKTPPMVIAWVYEASDQELAFSHPLCIPGSDATTLCTSGPLAKSEFHGAYSWAAFFFRFAVRERAFFTSAEAVRRLTSVPASILGLSDRGLLEVGRRADVAIFDAGEFGETTSTFEPNRLARGMCHVIVNGCVTLKDGRLTGERAGTVLRRTN
jgi:N-acyl-D-amino-acid deacylase